MRAGTRLVLAILAALWIAAPAQAPAQEPPHYVLAASWQPGFCETRPGVSECRTQTAQRFDAAHFSLHGLWPQPRGNAYCGVSDRLEQLDRDGRWGALPALVLDDGTRSDLERAMPGMRSGLHRHEWVRHGTCYGTNADEYFGDALVALSALNASPVRALFAANLGKALSARAIRDAFDAAFGEGAGARVEVVCRNDDSRRVITELRIALAGEIERQADLSELIRAGAARKAGCRSGVVDAAGLQ